MIRSPFPLLGVRLLRGVGLAMALVILMACGQKGDLYLPNQLQAQVQVNNIDGHEQK